MTRPPLSPTEATANRLRVLIAASGRSIRDVAAAAGIDQANLTRICGGQIDPRASTVRRLLDELGLRWRDLD